MDEPKTYASRKEIIDLARKREAMLVIRARAAIQEEQDKLNGMTQLLGCIAERHGEMEFSREDIESMHPGRMFIVERDGKWILRIREDASLPANESVVPEFVPDDALNKDRMAADGVDRVRFDGSTESA